MRKLNRSTAIAPALGMYLACTAATWWFEGRIQIFLRPEAMADRLVYALLVNLLLGVAGSIAVLRWLVRMQLLEPQRCGFPSPVRTLAATVLGLGLGLGLYIVQGAPTTDPVLFLNAYAQVFVVSAAEVMVCWALFGSCLEARLAPEWGRAATLIAGIVGSGLFGLYHFAHSGPFNTWGMVSMLSGIGLLTAAFFLISRDVLATALFHNFLGTFGVIQALLAANEIAPLQTLQVPLVGTALGMTSVLLAGHAWVRHAAVSGPGAPQGEW